MNIPQGWHSAPDNLKKTTNGPTSCIPVTVRKKWNSPLANIPKTQLPTYKSSNPRVLNKMCVSNTSQSQSSTSYTLPSAKPPSLVKEYQNEIEKLKKDLSTLKAENSILKAKVRRVDDENLQKGRQVEKLRAEIKVLQKNEAILNGKKNKELLELSALKAKCLRLEGLVKEKDVIINRLTYESAKPEKLQTSTKQPTVQKQMPSTLSARNNKMPVVNMNNKENFSDKSSCRINLTLRSEVSKLQGIIHKLEKENLDFQHIAKTYSQEVRRLKMQLKSRDKSSPSQSIASKPCVQDGKSSKESQYSHACNGDGHRDTDANPTYSVSMETDLKKLKPLVPAVLLKKSAGTCQTANKIKVPPRTKETRVLPKLLPTFTQNKNLSKEPKTTDNSSINNNQHKRTVKPLRMKNTGKPSSQISSQFKPISKMRQELDLERKAQEMRENISAKKIQRKWREHRENVMSNSSAVMLNGYTNEESDNGF